MQTYSIIAKSSVDKDSYLEILYSNTCHVYVQYHDFRLWYLVPGMDNQLKNVCKMEGR